MTSLQKFAATLTMALLSLPMIAQTTLGFRAGLVSGTVDAPSAIENIAPDFKNVYGTHFALISEIGITPSFSIQPELAFTQKGFTIKEGIDLKLFNIDLPLGVKAATKINYLEIPLLAKYKFGEQAVQGYVAAGPSLGLATSGRLKTKAQFILDIPISNTSLNLDNIGYKRFEVAGVLAAGLQVNTRNGGAFLLEARFTRGFTDTYTVPIFDIDVRNQGFGVGIGYQFPIGAAKYPKRA